MRKKTREPRRSLPYLSIAFEHILAHLFPHREWPLQLTPTISGAAAAWVLEVLLRPGRQVGRQQQHFLWLQPALLSDVHLDLLLCCFHIWIQAQAPHKHLHWSTFAVRFLRTQEDGECYHLRYSRQHRHKDSWHVFLSFPNSHRSNHPILAEKIVEMTQGTFQTCSILISGILCVWL